MVQTTIYDATPAFAEAVTPETLVTRSEPFGEGRFATTLRRMDRTAEAAWEWLQHTPVWPRLLADVPNQADDELELRWAGAISETVFVDGPLGMAVRDYQAPNPLFQLGMRVGAQFTLADHWDARRQSWATRTVEVAVNDDGTRGCIVSQEVNDGPNETHDRAMEALAWRAGGGILDVD